MYHQASANSKALTNALATNGYYTVHMSDAEPSQSDRANEILRADFCVEGFDVL